MHIHLCILLWKGSLESPDLHEPDKVKKPLLQSNCDEWTPKGESGRISSHSESWGSGHTTKETWSQLDARVPWVQNVQHSGYQARSTMDTEPTGSSVCPSAQQLLKAFPPGFPIFTYESFRVPQAITTGPVLKDGAGILHFLDWDAEERAQLCSDSTPFPS